MAIADVVAVVAEAVDGEDAADELRRLLIHRVDIELHQQVFATTAVFALPFRIVIAWASLVPHVADGQIYEEIIVGLSQLQETLTATDILHQIRCIAPDGVRRTHVDRGIESPARPRVVLG